MTKKMLTKREMMTIARRNPGRSVSPCGCIGDRDLRFEEPDKAIRPDADTILIGNLKIVKVPSLGMHVQTCLKCGASWNMTKEGQVPQADA